jgi:hypothetical protein
MNAELILGIAAFLVGAASWMCLGLYKYAADIRLDRHEKYLSTALDRVKVLEAMLTRETTLTVYEHSEVPKYRRILPDEPGHFGVVHKAGEFRLVDVVERIADHLGVRFGVIEAEPRRLVLHPRTPPPRTASSSSRTSAHGPARSQTASAGSRTP